MKYLNDPKYCLLICRVLPLVCFVIFGISFLLLLKGKNESITVPSMMIVFFVYSAFIFYYLPAILFEGNYRILRYGTKYFYFTLGTDPPWYLFFAVFTIGLGPVYWYWRKVDPVLKQMVIAGPQN